MAITSHVWQQLVNLSVCLQANSSGDWNGKLQPLETAYDTVLSEKAGLKMYMAHSQLGKNILCISPSYVSMNIHVLI